jgi:hypothetical protein
MQQMSSMKLLSIVALVVGLSSSCASQAADPNIKTLAPKGSFDVHYEQHLGLRVQKLVFKKKEQHPNLALTKDLAALERDGWRRCQYGAGDWHSYKDATKEPLTTIHSNTQVLVRDNAVLHILAFYRLGSGQKIGDAGGVQNVSVSYANLDNKEQLADELRRLDARCEGLGK